MANIWEKAISILAGNLNSSLSYLITTVCCYKKFTKKEITKIKQILQIWGQFGLEIRTPEQCSIPGFLGRKSVTYIQNSILQFDEKIVHCQIWPTNAIFLKMNLWNDRI